MEAYGDASGANGLMAVGVFLAPVERWVAFIPEWKKALYAAHPDLDVFHMTDFVAKKHQKHPYDKLTPRDRDRLRSRLLRLIADTAIYGMVCILSNDAYSELPIEDRMRLCHDNPYLLCADGCIGRIARAIVDYGTDEITSESVAYIFESGDKGLPAFRAAQMRIIADSEKYRQLFHVGSVTHRSKKDAPPLQTADILALEATHQPVSEIRSRGRWLSYLADYVPIELVWYDRERLAEFVRRATPEAMADITREFGLRVSGKQRKRKREK